MPIDCSALRSDGSRVGREDKMGGGRRFRNRGGKHRGYYKENANHGRFRQTPGKSHADYGLQRLGTSIVLHNGDDLMRQMHASLRLLAAAHDSCLDGVAARRRSFLPGHLIFAFATFGWAI